MDQGFNNTPTPTPNRAEADFMDRELAQMLHQDIELAMALPGAKLESVELDLDDPVDKAIAHRDVITTQQLSHPKLSQNLLKLRVFQFTDSKIYELTGKELPTSRHDLKGSWRIVINPDTNDLLIREMFLPHNQIVQLPQLLVQDIAHQMRARLTE